MLDRHALKTLLIAVGGRDRAALKQVWQDRSAALMALALRVTDHPPSAREAVEQTFVDVWQDCVDGQAEHWDAPDLELAARCRMNAVAARTGTRDPAHDDETHFEMTDPVSAGTGSTELLVLLQALGQMHEICREAMVSGYFDPVPRDRLAERLGIEADQMDADLRRCYAEIHSTTGMTPQSSDRDADIAALAQVLGFEPSDAVPSDDALQAGWETRLAPLHELLAPMPVDDAVYASVEARIGTEPVVPTVVEAPRSAGTGRTVIYAAIAIITAIVVCVVLIGLGDDAPARTIADKVADTKEMTDD
ncbi:MAG: hypothetical protein AAF293_05650 [Pseudomonadota bacterium]